MSLFDEPEVQQRKRDYSFEALVDVTGAELEALTKDERGRINAALKQLRELELDDYILADLIFTKARLWSEVYPEIALTPQALTGSWSSLEQKAEDQRMATRVAVNVYAHGECDTCKGDKLVTVGYRPAEHPPEGHENVVESGYEETAVCPDCNTADAGFWRFDGSHFTPLSADAARSRIVRSEE